MQEPHAKEPRRADKAEQKERRESKPPPPESTLPRDEASLRSSKAPTPPAGALPRATSAPVGASSAPPKKEKPAAAKPGSKSLAELVRDTDLEPDEEVARYGEMKDYVEAMAKNRVPEKGDAAEGGKELKGSSSGAFLGREGHAIPDEGIFGGEKKREESREGEYGYDSRGTAAGAEQEYGGQGRGYGEERETEEEKMRKEYEGHKRGERIGEAIAAGAAAYAGHERHEKKDDEKDMKGRQREAEGGHKKHGWFG
ncbi:unnamed protein product [Closterium sp. Naga37s-1]|nr:unnamed protein product [Closterium sp. Naga37s-1]